MAQLNDIIDMLESDVDRLENLKTKPTDGETKYIEGYRDGLTTGITFIKSSISVIKIIIKIMNYGR